MKSNLVFFALVSPIFLSNAYTPEQIMKTSLEISAKIDFLKLYYKCHNKIKHSTVVENDKIVFF